jgi:Ca2+-binding RTX toxin-like protein
MPNKSSHNIIIGTSGRDTLYGDAKHGDTLVGNGADQTIIGLAGGDFLYGDSSIMTGKAHGGNDIINGGEGPDDLYGDAAEMHQNSVGARWRE